jgi:tetratricopeptide (TPR) repeat protein
MQLRMEAAAWRRARELFDQCLAIDAGFAPAWAERGRLDRILAKYHDATLIVQAETALRRSLEIDPNSGPAHYYLAQLEIDTGRPEEALLRLVARAAARHAEPQVYAGLVHACRYCGLLRESVSAHHQARRLDPTITTSVLHTYYAQRDYERALEEAVASSDPLEARVLGAAGREREAIDAARREEARFTAFPRLKAYAEAWRAAFDGRPADVLSLAEPYNASSIGDGEGLFYWGEVCARAGLTGEALARLERAADRGYLCAPAYESSPYLQPLRGTAGFLTLLKRVSARQRAVAGQFAAAGGVALLS